MRNDSGQASVEWIGLVLLLALALAALVRFAPSADAEALGPELLRAIGCAARGGCEARSTGAQPEDGARPGGGAPRGMVSTPPLVPVAPRDRPAPPISVAPRDRPAPISVAPRDRPAPISRPLPMPVGRRGSRPAPVTRSWGLPGRLFRGGALARRAGRSASVLWRRSWMLCLGYERVRYGFLNPEIRFPNASIPYSEQLRIANDCLSPVDLVRDWDLIRGPR
jgi:hypothetical protein